MRRLFQKKLMSHAHHSALHRSLSTLDLILMGIGAIIGAGVFVLTGVAAATNAGPAVVISYALAGFAAMLAALSYAELAASIGGTGSAYSYTYAGLGELFAWIIGWDLLLEYAMSVATVSIGWSGYVSNFLQAIHLPLPTAIANNPFNGGVINLLATVIILVLACLLNAGTKRSARFNTLIVFIKLITIALFICVASLHIDMRNWHPFAPFGFAGITSGAALVFFAYIGFDALSTAVEEAKTPQVSIPIAIVTALVVCTLIYIIVSGLLTLIVPYTTLNVRSPVSEALLTLHYPSMAGIIALGAIAGLTTVMLVMYFGLTRIVLAITRDGLLPHGVAKINEHTGSPSRIIFITGIVMALIAGFMPIDRAAELVNIGTLAAFTFVCGGVIVLRYTQPDLHRPFKLPLNPLLPALGVFTCIYLMLHLSYVTWLRFIIWSAVGLAIYGFYGYKHSLLGRETPSTQI